MHGKEGGGKKNNLKNASLKCQNARDYLGKLDMQKSTDPNGMHPGVLQELVDVTAGPLYITLER